MAIPVKHVSAIHVPWGLPQRVWLYHSAGARTSKTPKNASIKRINFQNSTDLHFNALWQLLLKQWPWNVP
jgi:hypothetical protein